MSTFMKRPNSLLRSCKQYWIGHCNGAVFMYASSAIFGFSVGEPAVLIHHGFVTSYWFSCCFSDFCLCGFGFVFPAILPPISTSFCIITIFLKAFNKLMIVQFSAHFPPAFNQEIHVVWNYNKLYIFIQICLCKKYRQTSVLTQDEEYFKIGLWVICICTVY